MQSDEEQKWPQRPRDSDSESGFCVLKFSTIDLKSLWKDTSDFCRQAKAVVNFFISSSRSFLLRASTFKSCKAFSFSSVTMARFWDELETLSSSTSLSCFNIPNSLSRLRNLSFETSRSWLLLSNSFSKLMYFSLIALNSCSSFFFQEAISPPKFWPLMTLRN